METLRHRINEALQDDAFVELVLAGTVKAIQKAAKERGGDPDEVTVEDLARPDWEISSECLHLVIGALSRDFDLWKPFAHIVEGDTPKVEQVWAACHMLWMGSCAWPSGQTSKEKAVAAFAASLDLCCLRERFDEVIGAEVVGGPEVYALAYLLRRDQQLFSEFRSHVMRVE